jgi:peptidoglycan-N-acetylglucosamine deacetylase
MKSVYLTIDDTPGKDFVDKANYLYRHGIPAIFFCVGQSMLLQAEAVKAAIRRGFVIGNHSFSHPHFSDLPIEDCRQEILKTDELIERFYLDAGVKRPSKYFRFPYFDNGEDASGVAYESKRDGSHPQRFVKGQDDRRRDIQQFLGELGYRQPGFRGINPEYMGEANIFTGVDVRCTFDQMEYGLGDQNAPWGLSTEEAIMTRIEEDVPHEGRGLNREDTVDIVLVHDHDHTTALFYRIIDRYLEKRFRFLAVP